MVKATAVRADTSVVKAPRNLGRSSHRQGCELLAFAEVGAYAAADPATVRRAIARGELVPEAVDPWAFHGALVSRRSVDRWWRERMLARPVT